MYKYLDILININSKKSKESVAKRNILLEKYISQPS